jgi:hypothetical protein
MQLNFQKAQKHLLARFIQNKHQAVQGRFTSQVPGFSSAASEKSSNAMRDCQGTKAKAE